MNYSKSKSESQRSHFYCPRRSVTPFINSTSLYATCMFIPILKLDQIHLIRAVNNVHTSPGTNTVLPQLFTEDLCFISVSDTDRLSHSRLFHIKGDDIEELNVLKCEKHRNT